MIYIYTHILIWGSKFFLVISTWTGLIPEIHWASHNNTIGPADPESVQFISVGLAHDPQMDKAGLSLHAFIGTRATRLRHSLNHPANQQHVFPLPKG
jgi:hypothetical protein